MLANTTQQADFEFACLRPSLPFYSKPKISQFTCRKTAFLFEWFFFFLTHAHIGTFSGSFLALPEEVVFSTFCFLKKRAFWFAAKWKAKS